MNKNLATAKNIESAKATLKKKMLLLENLKTENDKLKNGTAYFKMEKNTLTRGFKESEASVTYYCKVYKDLKSNLDNTIEQQMRTELASEDIFHTIDMYGEKVKNLHRAATSCETARTADHDTDEILKYVEQLQNQVYQNSKLIEKLWTLDGETSLFINC